MKELEHDTSESVELAESCDTLAHDSTCGGGHCGVMIVDILAINEFNAYCAEHGIPPEQAPDAFPAWLKTPEGKALFAKHP